MHKSINLNDKTYDAMRREAIAEIPLYSEEWTNFNVSDPGITILENLTSFQLLQRSYINEVTDGIKRNMLKLLGYSSCENVGAKVLLECLSGSVHTLPSHYKLLAGELCFETTKEETILPWGIEGIFVEYAGEYKNITYLLSDRDVKTAASIFGPIQQEGMCLVIVLKDLPKKEQPLLLYGEIEESIRRNAFSQSQRPAIAQVKWQIFTNGGWANPKTQDMTYGFLKSGVISMQLEGLEPTQFLDSPIHGYAVRCVLTKADYDVLPKLQAFTANLFQVVQRDTRAASFVFHGRDSVIISSDMGQYGHLYVYCKEWAEGYYQVYSQYTGVQESGRFFTMDNLGQLKFDKARFGYGPYDGNDAIRVCTYDDETVQNRKLGCVYGYENQVLDIHMLEGIIVEDFCLLAQLKDTRGKGGFVFVKPDLDGEEDLCYQLHGEKGQIVIKSSGLLEGCTLFLCDCATTMGIHGNIRKENHFAAKHQRDKSQSPMAYINPCQGAGGTSFEETEILRSKFIQDMNRAETAVTLADYQTLVKGMSGLCIHKVKAVVNEQRNCIQVAVKPYGEEAFPKLSSYYQRQIYLYLNEVRMISTKIVIVQPEYIPISVNLTVNVKSYYEFAKETITKVLEQELDFVNSKKDFGETICYHSIYKRIEDIDLVDSIYHLQLHFPASSYAKKSGGDIVLGSSSLGYLGRLNLEVSEKRGRL